MYPIVFTIENRGELRRALVSLGLVLGAFVLFGISIGQAIATH